LNPVDPQLPKGAWFQPLKLKKKVLISWFSRSFAFMRVNSYRYFGALEAFVSVVRLYSDVKDTIGNMRMSKEGTEYTKKSLFILRVGQHAVLALHRMSSGSQDVKDAFAAVPEGGGLYKLNSVDPALERVQLTHSLKGAWFQTSNLKW
jgi:hypothetical protein